ncbi:MAG: DUF6465 family protein [Lachnospiraceae bacterium]|nr:DUF6465 family protein [Lachnospiraceae bacterium]
MTKKTTVTETKAAESMAVEVKSPATEEVKEKAAKTTVKKTAAKKTTVKAENAEESKKATRAAAKKATTRKTAAKKTSVEETVILQFGGREINEKDLTARVKTIWTETLGNKESDLKEIKIYVKPEEFAAYYVVNGDVTGSIDL